MALTDAAELLERAASHSESLTSKGAAGLPIDAGTSAEAIEVAENAQNHVKILEYDAKSQAEMSVCIHSAKVLAERSSSHAHILASRVVEKAPVDIELILGAATLAAQISRYMFQLQEAAGKARHKAAVDGSSALVKEFEAFVKLLEKVQKSEGTIDSRAAGVSGSLASLAGAHAKLQQLVSISSTIKVLVGASSLAEITSSHSMSILQKVAAGNSLDSSISETGGILVVQAGVHERLLSSLEGIFDKNSLEQAADLADQLANHTTEILNTTASWDTPEVGLGVSIAGIALQAAAHACYVHRNNQMNAVTEILSGGVRLAEQAAAHTQALASEMAQGTPVGSATEASGAVLSALGSAHLRLLRLQQSLGVAVSDDAVEKGNGLVHEMSSHADSLVLKMATRGRVDVKSVLAAARLASAAASHGRWLAAAADTDVIQRGLMLAKQAGAYAAALASAPVGSLQVDVSMAAAGASVAALAARHAREVFVCSFAGSFFDPEVVVRVADLAAQAAAHAKRLANQALTRSTTSQAQVVKAKEFAQDVAMHLRLLQAQAAFIDPAVIRQAVELMDLTKGHETTVLQMRGKKLTRAITDSSVKIATIAANLLERLQAMGDADDPTISAAQSLASVAGTYQNRLEELEANGEKAGGELVEQSSQLNYAARTLVKLLQSQVAFVEPGTASQAMRLKEEINEYLESLRARKGKAVDAKLVEHAARIAQLGASQAKRLLLQTGSIRSAAMSDKAGLAELMARHLEQLASRLNLRLKVDDALLLNIEDVASRASAQANLLQLMQLVEVGGDQEYGGGSVRESAAALAGQAAHHAGHLKEAAEEEEPLDGAAVLGAVSLVGQAEAHLALLQDLLAADAMGDGRELPQELLRQATEVMNEARRSAESLQNYETGIEGPQPLCEEAVEAARRIADLTDKHAQALARF